MDDSSSHQKTLTTPFSLGGVTLPSNILYAPLAGCSDFPFRQMSAKYHPGLMYCEMVSMTSLVRGDRNTLKMLDYCNSMRPIGGQICGSNPAIAGQAARIVEDLGLDVVDLNCGCPVDKVTKDGSGSGMLKTPSRIFDVIANMVAAVRIPVTVKIRAGWDEQSINATEITRLAEEAGAVAICIHGRTREQAYRGAANWDYIAQCKQVAKKIKVIGNGDLFSPSAAEEMFRKTGCDAILVARGTMGQPWIAQEIREHLAGRPVAERSLEDSRAALLEHFRHMLAYHPEQKAIIEMRRVGCWYLKEVAGARTFRHAISQATSPEEMFTLIEKFPGRNVQKEREMEEEVRIQVHAIARGKVQGVGFRALARNEAVRLGVTGTVANLPDGSVELYAQGTKAQLQQFLRNLSTQAEEISNLFTEYSSIVHPYEQFSIKY